MMFEVGKTYDFFYLTNENHWSKRGEVIESHGAQVKIKDEHGAEEVLNINHCFLESAKEFDIEKLRDLSDRLLIPIGEDGWPKTS